MEPPQDLGQERRKLGRLVWVGLALLGLGAALEAILGFSWRDAILAPGRWQALDGLLSSLPTDSPVVDAKRPKTFRRFESSEIMAIDERSESDELLDALELLSEDPAAEGSALDFAEDFLKEPELKRLWRNHQLASDRAALWQSLLNSEKFTRLVRAYARRPGFQDLVARLRPALASGPGQDGASDRPANSGAGAAALNTAGAHPGNKAAPILLASRLGNRPGARDSGRVSHIGAAGSGGPGHPGGSAGARRSWESEGAGAHALEALRAPDSISGSRDIEQFINSMFASMPRDQRDRLSDACFENDICDIGAACAATNLVAQCQAACAASAACPGIVIPPPANPSSSGGPGGPGGEPGIAWYDHLDWFNSYDGPSWTPGAVNASAPEWFAQLFDGQPDVGASGTQNWEGGGPGPP